MASSSIMPATKTISGLTNLRSKDLQDHLKKVGIEHGPDPNIPYLQALIVLNNLGLLKKGEIPNKNVLKKVMELCMLPTKRLFGKCKYRKLDASGKKWKHVEVLVRAATDEGELENLATGAPVPQPKPGHEQLEHLTPAPAVVNLLLTIIYANVARSKNMNEHQGCPTRTAGRFLQRLNFHPTFNTADELAGARSTPWTPAKMILDWICNKYGDILAEATGELRIEGMPDSVVQFVVRKPNPEFEERKAEKGNSLVLFHGTRLPNLFDILHQGLKPSLDLNSIWMSVLPRMSYEYAAGRRGDATYNPPPSMWQGDPYTDHGALLGCEVAGTGNTYDNDYDIHTILQTNPKDIAVRYVFLLTRPHMDVAISENLQSETSHGAVKNRLGAPLRADVAGDMLENFAKI